MNRVCGVGCVVKSPQDSIIIAGVVDDESRYAARKPAAPDIKNFIYESKQKGRACFSLTSGVRQALWANEKLHWLPSVH